MIHLELNKAIYKALTSNKFIQEYNIGVYFNIVAETKFPYIYIGSSKMSNISTKTEKLYKVISDIEIFNKNTGDNSVLIIIEEISKILVKENLVLPKGKLINICLVSYEVMQKTIGNIAHLSSKFEILIEEK